MTDEQVIRQIEAALTDLKAGDESAVDRILRALGAEFVDGDVIAVGDFELLPDEARRRKIRLWEIVTFSCREECARTKKPPELSFVRELVKFCEGSYSAK